MTRIKTHYNEQEYHQAIDEKFPCLSAWTLIQIEKHLGVYYVRAGVQVLYPAHELEKVLRWLDRAKEEGRLIQRKGFLVAPSLMLSNPFV